MHSRNGLQANKWRPATDIDGRDMEVPDKEGKRGGRQPLKHAEVRYDVLK